MVCILTQEAAQKGNSGCEAMQVQLGPAWQPLLLTPGVIQWLLDIPQTAPNPSTVLTAARTLIVQLCGVTGNMFSKDAEGNWRS